MASSLQAPTERSLFTGNEASSSAVSWPAIFAGTFAAVALSIVLTSLGAGLGLTTISAWPNSGASATAFTISAGIGLIVVQWLSSALGGFITGRLRTKWTGIHTHEVFFRDTAHGFLSWALATIVGTVLLAADTIAATKEAELKARQAADAARKATATFAIFSALSLTIGAFIASAAAAYGGNVRDEY
jgi:hypothetical protein